MFSSTCSTTIVRVGSSSHRYIFYKLAVVTNYHGMYQGETIDRKEKPDETTNPLLLTSRRTRANHGTIGFAPFKGP